VKTRRENSAIAAGSSLVVLAGLLGLTMTGARAADDFYKGKRITIMVSGAGSYEAYARLIAEHMPRHIPGQPAMTVRRMQGAGGIRATNYIYNIAPKDGTEIAATHAQIPSEPIYQQRGVEYDPTKIGWIGSITKETFVAVVRSDSPVKTLEEARKRQIAVGGAAVGGVSSDMPIISNAMLGTKFKVVTGYDGSPAVRLAVDRGELQGIFGDSYNSLRTGRPDWFSNHKVQVMTQFALKKASNLPDTPLFLDYVKNPTDRAAVELYFARAETGKPYFAPPGMPPGRLETLRAAFTATMKDPQFLGELEKLKFDMRDPMTGADVEGFVRRLAATPKPAINRLNAIFADYSTHK
jgi:tripartite-type tricarboxylate transporter receptor subunit TctC